MVPRDLTSRRDLLRTSGVVVAAVGAARLLAGCDEEPVDEGGDVASTVGLGRFGRDAQWEEQGCVDLGFDAHHPQGLARAADRWWLSTVDTRSEEGHLVEFDDDGELLTEHRIDEAARFHPGGMCPDADGLLWVPVAEYRPASSTAVWRVDPGSGELESAFTVEDHLGAIAHDVDRDEFVAVSWGSRRLLRIDDDGTITGTVTNPLHFVDWQDCQWFEEGLVVGGIGELPDSRALGTQTGGLGLLDAETLELRHAAPVGVRSPRAQIATRNAIWLDRDGDALVLHAVPDDGRRAVLCSWRVTPAAGDPQDAGEDPGTSEPE